MKKKIKFLFACVVFCCMMMIVPKMDAQAATNVNKLLTSGKTYTSYDFTGNGRKDTLKVTKLYDKDFYNLSGEKHYTGVKVYVNGKATKIMGDIFSYSIDFRLLRLQNGKCYLSIIGHSNNNDDGYNGLYRYTSGKVKKVVDLAKIPSFSGYHCQPSIASVKGNTINIDHFLVSRAMGGLTARFAYTYASSGLKRAKPYGKIVDAFYKIYGEYDALKVKKVLYTSYSCTSKIKTLPVGTYATATHIYMDGKATRIKVKLLDGTTGWVRGSATYDDSKLLFWNCHYSG